MQGVVPSADEYKKFFDETPVALLRTDLSTGRFLMANKFAVALFGFQSFDEMSCKAKVTDFYSKEDRDRLIEQIRKHGLVESYEIKFNINNKDVWVSARLRINCGGSCIEGSLIDISYYVEFKNKHLSSMEEMGKKLDKTIAALDKS
jgi:PAS domain-containing protein